MLNTAINTTVKSSKNLELANKEHLKIVDRLLEDILYGEHHTTVDKPATLKNGVRKLNHSQRQRFKKIFRKRRKNYSYTHFIPASGSGSRLFKKLIAFASKYDAGQESFSAYVNRVGAYSLNEFFKHLKELPFYDEFKDDITQINLSDITSDEKKLLIARLIVEDERLALCKLPKALVPLHKYKEGSVTAFEEQIACYRQMSRKFKAMHIHFTVSPAHLENFADALELSCQSNPSQGKVTFSIQDGDTDVYCLKDGKELLLGQDGSPIKRPSGHGALISNLDTVSEDIIHISNIDNISCRKYHKQYRAQRQVLNGYLMFVTRRIHKFLDLLEKDELSGKKKRQLNKFLAKYFHLDLPTMLENSVEGFHSTVYHLLNVPIRIAGVVPNEGKPGGAPYWVKNKNGVNTLQVVEKQEINTKIPEQKRHLQSSTHFNPVDMVIYRKDYKGNPFDLNEHAVDKLSMVVEKTQGADKIQYLERPGLWNGGMRNYLTMFIQLKPSSFNPVKEITDVLTKHHQSHD